MPTPMLLEIAIDVHTSNERFAGTDDRVTCEVLRDRHFVVRLTLEPGDTTQLDRNNGGDVYVFRFTAPFLVTPTVPSLSTGVAGIEYPQGFDGHLQLRLRNFGPDRWVKDTINVYAKVGELHRDDEGGGLVVWDEDGGWRDMGTFNKRHVLSTEPGEGHPPLTLLF